MQTIVEEVVLNCIKKDSCILLKNALDDNEKLREILLFGSRKFEELNDKITELTNKLNIANITIKELKEENELSKKQLQESQARANMLSKIAFGTKNEKSKEKSDHIKITARGAKKGHKGRGRKIPKNLPIKEEIIDIPDDEKFCPCCGLPYVDMQSEEISYEIHVEKKYYVKKIRRKKYTKTCKCPKSIITADLPFKLIPKGKFGLSFWVDLLINKFFLHLPIERQVVDIAGYGISISGGTISKGFKLIFIKYIQTLYETLIIELRESAHFHADETGWRVFVKIEGKENHKWFIWIFVTSNIVLLVCDPSRCAKVPLKTLFNIDTDDIKKVNKELLNAEGISDEKAIKLLNVDKFSSYKALENIGFVELALCWAHQRREFLSIQVKYPELCSWVAEWVEIIKDLYHINNERIKYQPQDENFKEQDKKLKEKIEEIYSLINNKYEHPEQISIMNSMKEHWKGLTLFVEHPEIPMDNNISERMIRHAVLGRKNYWGNHSKWGADLTVAMFSIIQTCLLNNISPRAYITYYLEECAKRGSAPDEDEIKLFLPHKLPEDIKKKLAINKHEILDDS